MSEHKKIAKRAGTVGGFTFLSRIAGLARDMAIAYVFGTLAAADAFFVAFRIPNLLRRLFAEGALTVSFVPVFTQTLRKSEDEAKRVARLSFWLLAAVLVGVSLVGVLASPWLVKLTAWGFSKDADKFGLTVRLTQLMFPYILLVSLAAWAMGVLNSLKHFAAPAASSIFMNFGIIAGALVFAAWFETPVYGLALGVMIGGFLQLAINFPPLIRKGFFPKPDWQPGHPAVKKIVGMMIPAAYGAAVYQFNVIIITLLASFLPTGSVSYLWYADRVMEFPLGIFAVSLATVILPTLSEHAADGDHEALKEAFGFALRLVFFVTVPAAAGLMILSDDIIRVLFQSGSFGAESSASTASALVFFAMGLPFISGVRVTSNAFYALQDARTPVRVANWSMAANILFSLCFMKPLGHSGLALAVSLSALVNFILQAVYFRRKVGRLGLKKMLLGTVRTVLASGAMAAAVWAFRNYVPLFPEPSRWLSAMALGLHIAVGVIAYVLSGWILRMDEFRELRTALRKRGKGKTLPPTDLSEGV